MEQVENFTIVLADKQRFPTNFALLQRYSTYYRQGFSGSFVERNQSYLGEHAKRFTITKFLAIVRYLSAQEDNLSNAIDKFPLNLSHQERWEDLLDLWLLADFLCADEITRFVENQLHGKAEAPGEGHEALSTQEFSSRWTKLHSLYHRGLRGAMVTAITFSSQFQNDQSSRDALLDQLPGSAQRAILHELMRNAAKLRPVVSAVVDELEKDEKVAEPWTWGCSGVVASLKFMFNLWKSDYSGRSRCRSHVKT